MNTTPDSANAAIAALPLAPCSASCAPDDRPDDDDFDNGEGRCHVCLGEGYVFGDEMDDPDWYEPGKTYNCPCCRGSGDAKDCTYW